MAKLSNFCISPVVSWHFLDVPDVLITSTPNHLPLSVFLLEYERREGPELSGEHTDSGTWLLGCESWFGNLLST